YTYNLTVADPDGPSATWSVAPGDTCGGTIDPSTGAYAFIPTGPTPPASCVLTVKVCDGGSPDLCATKSAARHVVAATDPPSITSSAPPSATERQVYAYHPTVDDPDGPGAPWSVAPGDTCHGSINQSTGVYTFTPPGPTPPPATCVLAVKVCDGGSPDLCDT